MIGTPITARYLTSFLCGGLAAVLATNGCAESVAPEPSGDDAEPVAGTEATAGMDGMPSGGRGGGGASSSGGKPSVAGAPAGGSAIGGGIAFSGSSSGGMSQPDGGADAGGEDGSGNAASGGASAGSSGSSAGGSSPSGGKTSSGGTTGSAGKSGSSGGGSSSSGAAGTGSPPSGGTGGGASIVNLLESSSFEAGTVDGWSKHGVATIAVSKQQAHTGSSSLSVTGRTADWHGVEYDVNSLVTPGSSYQVTVWARLATGSSGGLKLTQELVCTGETKSTFTWLEDLSTVPSDTWVELTGTLSVASSCTPTRHVIFVESPNKDASYYIDDTVLAAQ